MSNRRRAPAPRPPAVIAISAAQCRGARGMLAWIQNQLALEANVSRITVVEFEAGRRDPVGANFEAIRRTLETAGIAFIDGEEPGVKLRKRQR